jgi:hypothetical protein
LRRVHGPLALPLRQAGLASERYRGSRGRVDTWTRSSYVRLVETGSPEPGPGEELFGGEAVGTEEARILAADFRDAADALAALPAVRDPNFNPAAVEWSTSRGDPTQPHDLDPTLGLEATSLQTRQRLRDTPDTTPFRPAPTDGLQPVAVAERGSAE